MELEFLILFLALLCIYKYFLLIFSYCKLLLKTIKSNLSFVKYLIWNNIQVYCIMFEIEKWYYKFVEKK